MISKLKHMYCISIDNRIFNKISELGYIPVGLGDSHFSQEWITDKTGENISVKNKFYGEYTFHYFFWKNLMNKIPDQEWIGFCGYRRFWKNENNLSNEFKQNVLKSIPDKWNNFEVIIGDKLDLKIIKWIKVLKYGKIALAIEQLNHEDKIDFGEYVRINTSFNQGNMFITKSKKIMDNYYSILFEWLTRCEKIFGFDLYGYEKKDYMLF